MSAVGETVNDPPGSSKQHTHIGQEQTTS